MEFNKTYHGTMNNNSDNDYFKLSAPSNGKISLAFCHTFVDDNDDWDVYLYRYADGEYHELSYNDIDLDDSERITLPFIGAVSGGTYYLRVKKCCKGVVGKDYWIQTAFSANEYIEKEINDVYSLANSVSVNATYTGVINSSSDKDFYKIVTPSDGKLTVDFIHTYVNSYDDWDVYVDNYASGNYTSVAQHNIDLRDNTSFRALDISVKSGRIYYVIVKKCCSGVIGRPYSLKISFSAAAKMLAAPKMTRLDNTASGVKLTWGKVSGAVKYRVFVKSGSAWKKLGDSTGNTFVHKGAKSGVKYTYTVRCISANGKSFTSGYNTSGWAQTFIAAPALPTLKNTKNGVQVTWKKVAGAAKYRVFRKTGSGSWVRITDTAKTSVVDKTAKKGVTYTYTIRCISANGKSFTSAYNTKGRSIKCVR